MPYYTHSNFAYDAATNTFPGNGYDFQIDRTLVVADVPFRTKNAADIREKVKEMGFKFDADSKEWRKSTENFGFAAVVTDMANAGVSPKAIMHQIYIPMPHDTGIKRLNLAVPFTEKEAIKSMGGRWDAANRCWYVDVSAIGDGDMNVLNENRWIEDWPAGYTDHPGSGADLAIASALMMDFRAGAGLVKTATLQGPKDITATFEFSVYDGSDADDDMPVTVRVMTPTNEGIEYGFTNRTGARDFYHNLASTGYSPIDHTW